MSHAVNPDRSVKRGIVVGGLIMMEPNNMRGPLISPWLDLII